MMSEMQPACDMRTRLMSEMLAEIIRVHGKARVKVTGASMMPAVWPGDILILRRENIAKLMPGTIVLCRRDHQLQAHRVVKNCGDHLITRGDALAHDDPPVLAVHILGRATAIVRGGGEVPLQRPLWARIIGAVLCRSDLALRVLLRLVNRHKSYSDMEPACAS